MAVNLTAEIMALMQKHNASPSEGGTAIVAAMIICMRSDGFSKKRALKMISTSWDVLEPAFEQFKKEMN